LNDTGVLPKKTVRQLRRADQIVIGGQSLTTLPEKDCSMLTVLIRKKGTQCGKFTTGYATSYSIRHIDEGILICGKALQDKKPTRRKAQYEATVISLG